MSDFKLPPEVLADKLLDWANALQYKPALQNPALADLLRQAVSYLRSSARGKS